ncbi:hypothetical protein [Curtobacterium flaccumfaciens]|uniref:hypothetical protein n=1 Tax=Curtobacterium flaccumfaciens TaxID=2035 RepID=UPI001ADC07BD|nr:hypothetical protein [Curtobacterium flaccumfaciens]MBO9039088.1 hypothetical protein [Curtobacterium flaccumfaciens pv. flaccumfaciens]
MTEWRRPIGDGLPVDACEPIADQRGGDFGLLEVQVVSGGVQDDEGSSWVVVPECDPVVGAAKTGQHISLERCERGRVLDDADLLERFSRVTGRFEDGRVGVQHRSLDDGTVCVCRMHDTREG